MNEKWYLMKCKNRKELYHCHHLPIFPSHMKTDKKALSKIVKDEVLKLVESGATNNVITNYISSEYHVTLSLHLIQSLRTDRINGIIESWEDSAASASSVDRLLNIFKSMQDVSFIYVKHHYESGFVTYHRNKSEQSVFDEGTRKEIAEWRENLSLGPENDILVAFAWSHDTEKRKMLMFPEILCVDMTFGLNKERRNLVTFVGVDGYNKRFTGIRCWMPSKQTVAYRWAVDVAFPSLLGRKGKKLHCGSKLYNVFVHYLCTSKLYNVFVHYLCTSKLYKDIAH